MKPGSPFPDYLPHSTHDALEEVCTHHQKGRWCTACEVKIKEALRQAYHSGFQKASGG